MKFVIDRFEGEYAVCENIETQEMVDIPIELIPEVAQEGSVLTEENGVFELDLNGEEQRRQRIEEKMKGLWKK